MAGTSTEIKQRKNGAIKIIVRQEGRWGHKLFSLDEFRDLMAKGPETLERAEALAKAIEQAKGQDDGS